MPTCLSYSLTCASRLSLTPRSAATLSVSSASMAPMTDGADGAGGRVALTSTRGSLGEACQDTLTSWGEENRGEGAG